MSSNLNIKDIFEIENFYFQNCSTTRIEKIILQYEVFKSASRIQGDIIEFGVFKGISFLRLALFKKMMCKNKSLFGFDTFDQFPKANNKIDQKQRIKFIKEAGPKSVTVSSLKNFLKKKIVIIKQLLLREIFLKVFLNFLLRIKKKDSLL